MPDSFYVKKSFVDHEPGIEAVNIHYTWTALGYPPDWGSHRETRSMSRGGVIIRGQGGTTLDEHGQWGQTVAERVELPDDGVRRKVLRLPTRIEWDRSWHEHYAFHHCFEVLRGDRWSTSPLYTEEIVTREIEYVDHVGNLSEVCVYWSIDDWDIAQYTPAEEQNFVARYGPDNVFRAENLYGSEDKEEFMRIRSEMIAALPMPRRFVATVSGPRRASVHQGWHVGGMYTASRGDRWEDYWGWYTHSL
jgi:hypothetical protein